MVYGEFVNSFELWYGLVEGRVGDRLVVCIKSGLVCEVDV